MLLLEVFHVWVKLNNILLRGQSVVVGVEASQDVVFKVSTPDF